MQNGVKVRVRRALRIELKSRIGLWFDSAIFAFRIIHMPNFNSNMTATNDAERKQRALV